jgi:hypothetical protein
MDRRGTAGEKRAAIDAGITPSQGLPESRRRRTLIDRRLREHPYDADQDRSTGYDLEFVFSGARGLRVGVFRSLNRFARDVRLLDCELPYDDVVAEQFQHL